MNKNEKEALKRNKLFRDTIKAREAILQAANGATSVAGCIDCPVCDTVDALRYSVAFNGHVWASCKTEGCVAWME